MSEYSKENPYPARLTENTLLNKEGSAKETCHFVVDLGDSGLSYSAGDSLGVYPENAPDAVEVLIKQLGFNGDESVIPPRGDTGLPLREVLARHCALAQPTKKFIMTLKDKVAGDAAQSARVAHLLDRANSDELKAYLAEREFADLLEDFPAATFEPQEFVNELKRLTPRLYSIASSPAKYPNEIHLTVAIVRYQTNGRDRIGVASSYLADRVELNAPTIPVYVQSSHFRLPEDPTADVIMVGPGTGVAPFRAFIQERVAADASGRNWLFFGDQKRSFDYLYEEEMEAYVDAGSLDRLDLAFSRDQEQKIYVQDRMLEGGAELWAWLESGAYFYVCGDASRMAKDVEQALLTIASTHGGLDEAGAKEFLKQLRKDKRYQKDVY